MQDIKTLMGEKPSYYEILSVSPKASDDEIKRAYHSLAKKFHPDRNPRNKRVSELRFRLISEAYAGLKTREKRAVYNQSIRLNAQNDNKTTGGFFSQIGEIFWPQEATQKEQQ